MIKIHGDYGWKERECETTRNDKTKWMKVLPDERGKAVNDRKNASVTSFFLLTDSLVCFTLLSRKHTEKANRENKQRKHGRLIMQKPVNPNASVKEGVSRLHSENTGRYTCLGAVKVIACSGDFNEIIVLRK